MKIAVEGCAHGELELVYDTIELLQEKQGIKVDLLICCGDFQASRNEADLHCMAVPPKYCDMCSFYKYYTGEKTVPVLTIFVGGNHEASNYLQELPYGGWVAPKIYYLGYAGVINVGGLRIGGLSGIYKSQDYMKGHFEKPPYDNSTKRSVYHIRNLDVFRLKQVSGPIDIFISHDWPTGICNHGNQEQLLRFKPFFKDDIESDKLGSKPCEELLDQLKPQYWFAAHLHCKFAALVPHADGRTTKFLALDKCLPQRRFLQVLDVPHNLDEGDVKICYDAEWLAVLRLTNHLLSVKVLINYLPGPSSIERWQFTPTPEEKSAAISKLSGNLVVPDNFVKTAEAYNPRCLKQQFVRQPQPQKNPQTALFCSMLEVDDPMMLLNAFADQSSMGSLTEDVCEDSDEGSDCFETFIKATPPRSSLSLPEPKISDVQDDSLIASALSAICDSSETSQEANDCRPCDTISPVPCKFKRRNASIYQSEET